MNLRKQSYHFFSLLVLLDVSVSICVEKTVVDENACNFFVFLLSFLLFFLLCVPMFENKKKICFFCFSSSLY